MENTPTRTGYAPVNGLNLYYEIHGEGTPLILLHGGFGLTTMFGEVLPQLARDRQVIAADLQGHGRTADIDRPLRFETMADDIAALIRYLGFERANVMGYSLGGAVALRTAIQHPELVNKLVIVSSVFRRNGWYPEMAAQMGQMNATTMAFMRDTPMYHNYRSVAPHPENFPRLLDKMGELLRQDYDWTEEVRALSMPTMMILGDADSAPPSHAVEFFELQGGGQRDGGWDGSGMSQSRLAILPGATHYDIFYSPLLASLVPPFLDASP